MRRRDFMAAAGGAAAAAWPLGVRAQQPGKTRRLALVHSGLPANTLTETAGPFWVRRLFEELRRLGYTEGKNLVVERYSAEGSGARFAGMAAEVVSGKPDVIVNNDNALTKAMLAATSTIPIVAITTDPVAAGLIASLARPGGNLTGVSVLAGEGLVSKRLQILREAAPATSKVGFLQNAGLQPEAAQLRLVPLVLTEVDDTHIRDAFDALSKQGVGAVMVSDGGSLLARSALIIALAAQHRLPAIYPYRDYALAGGLIAYAPDLGELAKRMASDVSEIFRGAKPGDIPYFLPTKFELLINLKTAAALGLTMPTNLLALADEVIE
jgi:putative tryptophan/tyrosine transport system substrate-binding protein